ncbi:hypothetical protein PHYPSEUDO_000943 [Phytophthora pseudosyringae]|uniref:FAM194 C-terminal domain-containing protein n=1 Tax=Phytophthora pseudosyringae TaxID=221518 RepID=A0A8T1VXF9_9STRA|nr:hypothetical protein PHYPSEUDO_000943 [Phytophthora pseudosyringae]
MGTSRLALAQNYPTGEVAVRLDDLGCGFCYYASGRVAACVNKINDYQRSFQFYEDNKKRTLLATLDEHAVGSAGRPDSKKMILTKESGIILDGQNTILKTWRWDSKAQRAGSPPSELVVINLNDSLVLTYRDRSSISIEFAPCPGILVDFACGECLRRTDSYFDHARRVTEGPHRGKLLIDQNVPTLQQRQKRIELESLEKRSKSKPRSKDLAHDQIKQIVTTLETKFDGYEGCQVTPAPDGSWREKAHLQSLREIPVLPVTGFEAGQVPTLFGSVMQANDASESLKRLKNEFNGKWLGSVEIHKMITQENPGLLRTGSLTNASGRYSQELQVTGGGTKQVGERLTAVRGSKLDSFLREKCANDELVVVACLRADDRQSRAAETMLEQVQLILSERKRNPGRPTTAAAENKCCLVKCDLAESPALADRYRIHAVPTFLMFYDSRLVNVSSLGGLALRVAPATKNANLSGQMDHLPRVLLVEKMAKQQLAVENFLRREGFQWDLASSGEQAVSYFTRQPSSGASGNSGPASGYELIVLSDSLTDGEMRAIDRFVGPKESMKRKAGRRVLVCVVVSAAGSDIPFAKTMCPECRRAQGRRVSQELTASTESREPPLMACPHCSLVGESSAKTALLPPVLAGMVQAVVYKHVKAATLHRLAEMWAADEGKGGSSSAPPSRRTLRHDGETHLGLTPFSFFSEVDKQIAAAKRGAFLPEHRVPEMALSAKDTVLAGRQDRGGLGMLQMDQVRSASA